MKKHVYTLLGLFLVSLGGPALAGRISNHTDSDVLLLVKYKNKPVVRMVLGQIYDNKNGLDSKYEFEDNACIESIHYVVDPELNGDSKPKLAHVYIDEVAYDSGDTDFSSSRRISMASKKTKYDFSKSCDRLTIYLEKDESRSDDIKFMGYIVTQWYVFNNNLSHGESITLFIKEKGRPVYKVVVPSLQAYKLGTTKCIESIHYLKNGEKKLVTPVISVLGKDSDYFFNPHFCHRFVMNITRNSENPENIDFVVVPSGLSEKEYNITQEDYKL